MKTDQIKPLKDRVLVRPITGPEKIGGIFIPQAARETPWEAKVIACGPLVAEVIPGDLVIVSKYAGTELKIDGIEHKIFSVDDLIAVVSQ